LRAERRPRGFTLLELVVVVAIIAILASIAVLSIGNRALEDRLDSEARRLKELIALAADEAVLQGTELGFVQTREGYSFLALNREGKCEGKWQPLEESGALRTRALLPPFYLQLRVDGRLVTPLDLAAEADKEHELKPQVLLLSSGEATQFVLDVRARDYGPHYTLEGDLLGRMKLEHRDTAS
jgi:general secretion pathway protein H